MFLDPETARQLARDRQRQLQSDSARRRFRRRPPEPEPLPLPPPATRLYRLVRVDSTGEHAAIRRAG
jgi:hypothetical protein